ncbi:hypothetical protein [Sphingomonas adhaesiva]|uniref:hypothetical protein n=1 Tax=Sphingomonas adhaesiva TaxID=28212 RepID=UPI002FF5332A
MRSIDRTAALGTILALLLPATAHADVLVVRATGPSAATYPVGRKLSDTARLKLAAGDAIVLIDAKGTRVLRGPGVFSANAASSPAPASAPSFALAQNDNRRVRVGAVRSAPGITAERPSLWMIDVSKPGPVCLLDTNAPPLWRPDATAAGKVTITPVAGGPAQTAAWEAGQSSAAWPAALPIADGARFRLTGPGTGTAPVEVTVKVIAAPGTELTEAAGTLIAAGCKAQLDQLVAASLPAN